MTLSSTMRTLIGGTVPSSKLAEAGLGGGAGSPLIDLFVLVAVFGLPGSLLRPTRDWPV